MTALKNRFYSLDVFRGATVALMILVNNPGSWGHIHAPFAHAPWHGVTPTDLVFPFFLFAVGNAMAFVMPSLRQAGQVAFLKKVLTRSLLIFLIGLLLHWSPFVRWQDDQLVFKSFIAVRIFGVLQRIALCYLFASLIVYYLRPKGAFIAGLVMLAAYWFLCLALGSSPDPYSLEGFWGTHLDRAILGADNIYKGEGVPFEPEGLASTLPAIVQVIFGFLAGDYIRRETGHRAASPTPAALELPTGASPKLVTDNRPAWFDLLTHLFVAGCVAVFAGLCWSLFFPLNKKIWSSSYVFYTTGLAILVLGIAIYFIEVRLHRGWLTRFFDVFGKNPLFIFVLSGFLPRLLGLIRIYDHDDPAGAPVYLTPFGWFYTYVCKPLFSDPRHASLLYALAMVVFYWLIVYWMDKKRIYVKV